jgi:mannonate dehydratase
MDRRKFLTTGTAAAGAAALAGCQPSTQTESAPARPTAAEKPVRLYPGEQRPTTDQWLSLLKRHGVNHVCASLDRPPYPERGFYTVEELVQLREKCESFGIKADMLTAPFLPSSHIDREERGDVMLGKEPGRQRDIDDFNKTIENCKAAGIPAIKYNMSLLGVVRTERTPGRGGSSYSTWKLSEAKPEPPLTRAGNVDADTAWERITHFVQNVAPVADANQIKIACHPHDPGMPPEGYQGVVRVLGTPEGLYRFAGLSDSPYHGFNLCLGTTAEMLQDPATEIHDVIRQLGGMKKIFNIHFRNIVGKRDNFIEVYPDEGDMVMPQVLRTLYEVDYDGMLMPDHMPSHPDDPGGMQGFSYALGYIQGLIQSLKHEIGQDIRTDGVTPIPRPTF